MPTFNDNAKTLPYEQGAHLIKSLGAEIVQSLKPSMRQHWLTFTIFACSTFLSFAVFGVNTITGLSILSISGILFIYSLLSVCTTQYLITHRGIWTKKGPFSRKFKGISYGGIDNISITQGTMQKKFKIGNLAISTNQVNCVFKGIKNPHQVKELINNEKASEYKRRTLLKNML